MRVFILCPGRTGSKSLIRACEYFDNFTSGHETRTKMTGEERFNYPDNHIEADNRLSWFLGTLDKKFGKDAFYIHLTRDREQVVESFKQRWSYQGNIIKSFSEGILLHGFNKKNDLEKTQIVRDYCETVTNNIESFLKDKPHKIDMRLETINDDFVRFSSVIGAKGDLSAALESFSIPLNTTKQSNPSFINRIKNKLNN